MPDFNPQDTTNGKGSIPDFAIQQSSFKLIVEAKEGGFDIDQIERHLDNLVKQADYKLKLLIALSPSNTIQGEIDGLCKKYKGVHIKHKTYMDLYTEIYEVLDKQRDFEFLDVLNDYVEYCEHENLIDYSDDTVMVRLAGDTLEFNMKNGIYYDGANNNAYGFKYLALYKDKRVQALGKIIKVIEAHEGNGEIVYGETRYYTDNKYMSESDKIKIQSAIEDRKSRYGNEGYPHWHYIVDEFVKVQNFEKKSKGGLYGKKKFSLKNDFGITNKVCSIYEIVDKMNKLGGWGKSEE
ncbi:MAG: hypothetical protein J1E81_10000 [Eubacterium sp.]|nr:hypothetical protein [Eubacterium sp.]